MTIKTQTWKNYGDVNPFDHGGIWVKKESDNQFDIIRYEPEDMYLSVLSVDITDNWIEKESVMSFIGMTEKNFDSLQFAIGCTDFYSHENFGRVDKVFSISEVEKLLKARGITV